ncbi:protein kinase [Streptomyces sp. NPDC057877]|uniref:serine/threonine-protein kinase n=1 Tax=Streptomyces sp. NPDC057877 TaxID=3346269 RepID=UPI0036B56BAC
MRRPESGFVGEGNRFRLIKHHDQGGMGDVWEAQDRSLNRRVALKFLAFDRLAGAFPRSERVVQIQKWFAQESQTMARVQSPYVATIHDRCMDGDTPFLVMEFVEGLPLGEHLGPPPLSRERTILWSTQIAEGLEAAHRVGVVHRDIKPGNILITDDLGDVRIVDFGLARFADATESHHSAGTPLYSSPERCRLEAGTGQSDLYSLGCVMYEMVTGWPPFGDASSDPAALARAHQFQQPVSPRAQRPEVPRLLDELIMKLLAKEPSERPPNARAVIHALRQVERGSHHAVDPPTSVPDGRAAASTRPDAGYAGRIRALEKRVRQLRVQFGSRHPDVLKARLELAETTGESGDARGAAAFYDQIGDDCQRWFGPHDTRTLDAYEGVIRWVEAG